MADFDRFDFGGVHFPLTDQVVGASLLAACDPALAKIIDYLSFEIDTKIARALKSALAAGTPPVGKNIAKKFSIKPVAPHVKADQLAFPFFAVWRDETKTTKNRTLNWLEDVHTLGWCYVLPTMTLEWADKFAHVLRAVDIIVAESLHQGFDPAYNHGERIFTANNISYAQRTTSKYGPYQIGDLTDTVFHGVFGEIEMAEQTTPNTTGYTVLTGTDFTISQQSLDDVTATVAADASVGATTLVVDSTDGLSALDVIRVGEGTTRDESISVVSVVDETHLTLASAGLAFAHTAAQADTVKRAPVTIVSAKSEVG